MTLKPNELAEADGRLIHRAAGVLDAAGIATRRAEQHPPHSKAYQALKKLADELRDRAWNTRQRHNELNEQAKGPSR